MTCLTKVNGKTKARTQASSFSVHLALYITKVDLFPKPSVPRVVFYLTCCIFHFPVHLPCLTTSCLVKTQYRDVFMLTALVNSLKKT